MVNVRTIRAPLALAAYDESPGTILRIRTFSCEGVGEVERAVHVDTRPPDSCQISHQHVANTIFWRQEPCGAHLLRGSLVFNHQREPGSPDWRPYPVPMAHGKSIPAIIVYQERGDRFGAAIWWGAAGQNPDDFFADVVRETELIITP